MLLNKSDKEVVVRYNGKEINVAPGEKIDVRDFDVANKDVKGTEKHITMKNPGVLEVVNEKSDNQESKESKAEIKELKAKLLETQKELKETQKALEDISVKHQATAGEIEAAKKELNSVKIEYTRFKKVNEELEHEVEQLRLQLGTGKKK